MSQPCTLYRADTQTPTTDRRSFQLLARPGHLSLGLMLPIESYAGDAPRLDQHLGAALLAERLGFVSLGIRDVPLREPAFGDVGQLFDPWVYLGFLAAHTSRITLLTTSIVLPIRHPVHTAKAASSVDQLSGGRLVLGVASGDRASEFPAFGVNASQRGELLREQFPLLRKLWSEQSPEVSSRWGSLSGADVLPKPSISSIPLLVTGHSQSDLRWIAENADGWLMYPRDLALQRQVVREWRDAVGRSAGAKFKPFLQSYYIDLDERPDASPRPIHLGHRLGRSALLSHLAALEELGVNHVILNLKYGMRPALEVVQELGEFVLPRSKHPDHRPPAPGT